MDNPDIRYTCEFKTLWIHNLNFTNPCDENKNIGKVLLSFKGSLLLKIT